MPSPYSLRSRCQQPQPQPPPLQQQPQQQPQRSSPRWPQLKAGRLLAVVALLIACVPQPSTAEYRAFNGNNNNMQYPTAGNPGSSYIQSYNLNLNTATMTMNPSRELNGTVAYTCAAWTSGSTDVLPPARCISDMAMSYNLSVTDYQDRSKLLSTPLHLTHMVASWAHFIAFDLTAYSPKGVNDSILLPTDDASYQSQGFPTQANITFGFTESLANVSIVPSEAKKNIRTGLNKVTAFLDGSVIYGSDDADALRVRPDQTKCKLKTRMVNGAQYPPLQADGFSYDVGYNSIRSADIFTGMLNTMFIREHNRWCDALIAKDPTMDSEIGFQETRVYIIALLQKITYTEYMSAILGKPLPPYAGYDPTIYPGINTFWTTVAFRYGHSEISNSYTILDPQGQPMSTLALQDTLTQVYLEQFGFENVARTASHQTQEEVDGYYSDAARSYKQLDGVPIDLAQADMLRSRDHGIPLYNDARKMHGLAPYTSIDNITTDAHLRAALNNLYGGDINKVESTIGGMSEDLLPGANLGPLFNASIAQEFMRIRAMDRFWYQIPGVLSPELLQTVEGTQLGDILIRNFVDNSTLPSNVWAYQPDPPNHNIANNGQTPVAASVQMAPGLVLTWIMFSDQVEITATITGSFGWFAFALSPSPTMAGAQFFVTQHDGPGSALTFREFQSNGNGEPPTPDNTRTYAAPKTGFNSDGVATTSVTISRMFAVPGKVTITTQGTYLLHAWHPTNPVIGYHGSSTAYHGAQNVNFFTAGASGELTQTPMTTRKWHGIGMFISWAVVFPFSIFVVRYQKHRFENAIGLHRQIQVLTGVSITSLATAAIATATDGTNMAHKYMGLTILGGVLGQLGLGVAAIYTMDQLESANRGIPLIIKWCHRILGTGMLILAWINIRYGLIAYRADQSIIYAYYGYMATMIISVSIYHWRWARSGQTKTAGGYVSVAQFMPKDVEQPIVSWDDINDRVSRGAMLVVVDNFVFDIRKWIPAHPGGKMVLMRVIGTDISREFYSHAVFTEKSKAEKRSSRANKKRNRGSAGTEGEHLGSHSNRSSNSSLSSLGRTTGARHGVSDGSDERVQNLELLSSASSRLNGRDPNNGNNFANNIQLEAMGRPSANNQQADPSTIAELRGRMYNHKRSSHLPAVLSGMTPYAPGVENPASQNTDIEALGSPRRRSFGLVRRSVAFGDGLHSPAANNYEDLPTDPAEKDLNRKLRADRLQDDLPTEPKLSLQDRASKFIEEFKGFAYYLDKLNHRLNKVGTRTLDGSDDEDEESSLLPRIMREHAHSALAMTRLATMVIGRLSPSDIASGRGAHESTARRTGAIAEEGLNDLNDDEEETQEKNYAQKELSQARFYRRFVLISKTTLSSEETRRPVRRFAFKSSHPDLTQKGGFFYPGEYVEIQCIVQGQVTVRSYTPVEGNINEGFALYVKIYPDGLMSTFLDHQMIGYEVKIRGPFELNERQTLAGFGNTGGFKPRYVDRLLLNKTNPIGGCWNQLLMVAFGSGLTPALQLIQYHIRYLDDLPPSFRMHLLFFNHSVKDVFAGSFLDHLVIQSKGRLLIQYAIKEAPGAIVSSVTSPIAASFGARTQPSPMFSPALTSPELEHEHDHELFKYMSGPLDERKFQAWLVHVAGCITEANMVANITAKNNSLNPSPAFPPALQPRPSPEKIFGIDGTKNSSVEYLVPPQQQQQQQPPVITNTVPVPFTSHLASNQPYTPPSMSTSRPMSTHHRPGMIHVPTNYQTGVGVATPLQSVTLPSPGPGLAPPSREPSPNQSNASLAPSPQPSPSFQPRSPYMSGLNTGGSGVAGSSSSGPSSPANPMLLRAMVQRRARRPNSIVDNGQFSQSQLQPLIRPGTRIVVCGTPQMQDTIEGYVQKLPGVSKICIFMT